MSKIYNKYKELIIGLFFGGFAIIYLIGCTMIPKRNLGVIGAEFVPYLLGYFLLFLAILQCVEGIRIKILEKKTENNEESTLLVKEDREKKDYIGVIITFSLLFIYILLIQPLGFILASAVYLFLQITSLVPKNEKKKHALHAILSVSIPLVTYYSFRLGLDLLLPIGWIFG